MVLEFFHDGGDYVPYANTQAVDSVGQLTTSWADSSALTMPSFSTRAIVYFGLFYNDATSSLDWRTNGHTDTNGHQVSISRASITHIYITIDVITDAAQKIEWKEGSASTNTYSSRIDGWYFPVDV